MAKKKRGDAHTGGHGWFVTFADLMGLMMSFFVMLVAFSSMDNNKLKIVAGSMRDAFGSQTNVRYSGIIESDGLPTRPKLKNVEHISPEETSDRPTPDEKERNQENGAKLHTDRAFALASASLRQALQDMPELTEMSKHIMFEETKEGLNLEIIDQDGRSMFADGSKVPYDRTRRLIQKLAGPLRQRRCAYPSSATPPPVSCRRAATMERSTCRRTAPTRCARSWSAKGCPLAYLRRLGQGRQPAVVSGRSFARGKPSRHHHLDA